eukprot:4769635-Alexandrium_andersonii.AAC.1
MGTPCRFTFGVAARARRAQITPIYVVRAGNCAPSAPRMPRPSSSPMTSPVPRRPHHQSLTRPSPVPHLSPYLPFTCCCPSHHAAVHDNPLH